MYRGRAGLDTACTCTVSWLTRNHQYRDGQGLGKNEYHTDNNCEQGGGEESVAWQIGPRRLPEEALARN